MSKKLAFSKKLPINMFHALLCDEGYLTYMHERFNKVYKQTDWLIKQVRIEDIKPSEDMLLLSFNSENCVHISDLTTSEYNEIISETWNEISKKIQCLYTLLLEEQY